tara:strand:+ start:115 stop:810 length:696 start_codon:yes stop_codon:yes gene_type:complete
LEAKRIINNTKQQQQPNNMTATQAQRKEYIANLKKEGDVDGTWDLTSTQIKNSKIAIVKSNLLISNIMSYLDMTEVERAEYTGDENADQGFEVTEQQYIQTMNTLMNITRVVIPLEKIKIKFYTEMLNLLTGKISLPDVRLIEDKRDAFQTCVDLYTKNLIDRVTNGTTIFEIGTITSIYDRAIPAKKGVVFEMTQEQDDRMKTDMPQIEDMFKKVNAVLDATEYKEDGRE